MTGRDLSALLEQAGERIHVGAPPISRMVADATRQRRRRALAVTLTSGAAMAVTVGGVALLATPEGSVPPDPSSGSMETGTQRQTDIYTVVLKESVNAFGDGATVPSVVYVQDRARSLAGAGTNGEAGEPVPEEMQSAITAGMSDTADIEWVTGEGAALLIRNPDEELVPCFSMREPSSLLITLDTLLDSGHQHEVSVAATGQEANKKCVVYWLNTYIVDQTSDGWEITGYTTPMGIS
jgi:hypothetical protein